MAANLLRISEARQEWSISFSKTKSSSSKLKEWILERQKQSLASVALNRSCQEDEVNFLVKL